MRDGSGTKPLTVSRTLNPESESARAQLDGETQHFAQTHQTHTHTRPGTMLARNPVHTFGHVLCVCVVLYTISQTCAPVTIILLTYVWGGHTRTSCTSLRRNNDWHCVRMGVPKVSAGSVFGIFGDRMYYLIHLNSYTRAFSHSARTQTHQTHTHTLAVDRAVRVNTSVSWFVFAETDGRHRDRRCVCFAFSGSTHRTEEARTRKNFSVHAHTHTHMQTRTHRALRPQTHRAHSHTRTHTSIVRRSTTLRAHIYTVKVYAAV